MVELLESHASNRQSPAQLCRERGQRARIAFDHRGALAVDPVEFGFTASDILALDTHRMAPDIYWGSVRPEPGSSDDGRLSIGTILTVNPLSGTLLTISNSVLRELSEIFQRSEMQGYLMGLLGEHSGVITLRRAQFNVMREGDFVASHVDNASDPAIRAAVVFQLAAAKRGGVFCVVPPCSDQGSPLPVPVEPGCIIVSRGDVAHLVTHVNEGIRVSLACFVGHSYA